ncbi:TetR/AcrR family transcriptional regulator [Williamsia sterculiae]|nr:TetR/AcrR family transcriptional regulator [Williamsia sterculiae]
MPRAHREAIILDAAVAEFGRDTYMGARVAAIAASAGVSKPLVMQYFGSKEGLFVACVTRAGDSLASRIDDVLAAGTPTLMTAADTLAAIFAALQPRPHDWTVLQDRTTTRGSHAYTAAQEQRRRISGQGLQGVSALLAATPDLGHIEPDDVAVLADVWEAIVTSMVQWWLRHPDQTADQMTARSYRVLDTIARLGTTISTSVTTE